jgi:hypothetical protein
MAVIDATPALLTPKSYSDAQSASIGRDAAPDNVKAKLAEMG